MTSENRIAAAERQRQALELRKAGLTLAMIARRLGYASPSGVHKAIAAAMHQVVQAEVDELRQLESERIDALWRVVYPRATRGHLPSVDRCIRLMKRRADLLGLDAPKAVAADVAIELSSSVRRLAEVGAEESGLDVGVVMAEAEVLLAKVRWRVE